MAKGMKNSVGKGSQNEAGDDPEFEAMITVYRAIRDLMPDAQNRVIQYVVRRLALPSREIGDDEGRNTLDEPRDRSDKIDSRRNTEMIETGAEGVNPVAQKWMKRNGLSVSQIGKVFSIDLDEIDLIARAIPGNQTKEKMHNVLLLKALAGYLSAGAARVSDETLREACVHYGAYDSANFTKYLRSFSPEVSGTKESGYTLTPLGITSGTELIKVMTETV